MFGLGKKKTSEPQRPERGRRSAESKERKSQNLAQLGFLTGGLGDDGDIDNLMGGMEMGDDDLEEELAMLLEGNQPSPRRPKVSPKKKSAGGSSGVRRPAEVSKNFDMDNPALDEEDDADLDIDDPDLEAELGDILGVPTTQKAENNLMDADEDDSSEETPPPPPTMTTEQLVKLLEERLDLYEKAKSAADTVNDSAKSRRFARGVKTLKEMIPKAKAGRVIDEANIPPTLSIGTIKNDRPPASAASESQVPPRVPPRNFQSIQKELPPESEQSAEIPEVNTATTPVYNDTDNQSLQEPLIPTPAYVSHPVPSEEPKDFIGNKDDAALSSSNITIKQNDPSIILDPAVESRLKEYKRVAVALKRQGEVQGALKYLKLSKELESRMKSGEIVDLSQFPSVEIDNTITSESNNQDAGAGNSVPAGAEALPPTVADTAAIPSTSESNVQPPGEDIFGAPPPPSTIMEALEQRLAKYKSEVEKATAASNSSKARRMGRIVKQYEEAIANYKKGKLVSYDELPTPPGFAPIPVGGAAALPNPSISSPRPAAEPINEALDNSTGSPEKRPKQESPKPGVAPGQGPSPGTSGSMVSRSGKPGSKLTLQEKQLQIILLRQQQFKEAALNAKKRGDVNQAREFLRTAKGFDKLIQVAQAGLPVDMATLPSPPEAVARLELEDVDNFEVISASDCIMPEGGTVEVFAKLENDLKQQLKMCMRTRDHFKSIGDIGSANRFESMALESKKDLDALRLAMKKNSGLPKYHYENRIFSITECNTDVTEDEIEICIVQGINYKVSNPADVDTYVKVELPYPSAGEAQSHKTHVVKDTNNPAYNATYKMTINRTARNFQRFVHRHGFKCEVWSKGGFLRGSTLIGTATVKLLPLETKCTLHDAFDILDGRKSVGKLEVKVRIREPVLAKQITQKKEKWLSIDRV